MEKKTTFRAFIAIDLPEDEKNNILKIINQLKRQPEYFHVRWSKAENLHITLRFLGNISLDQQEIVSAKMADILTSIEPFTLSLSSLMIFPTFDHPVAIALKPEPITALIKLNQVIEASLETCHVQQENQSFYPHLTLGKMHTPIKRDILPLTLNANFLVDSLKLFRSDTSEAGSVYTPLACWFLG